MLDRKDWHSPSYNTAYTLRASPLPFGTLPSVTSYVLKTLYDICISHGCDPNVKRERLMERRVT